MKGLRTPFVVLVVVILTMAATGLAKDAKPSFSMTITAPEKVEVGSVVELNIVVRNVSDHPIMFGYDGPTHNETNFTFDVRDSVGNVPSASAYMKGPGPSVANTTYRPLEVGETLNLSIDLCKMFELPPGRYTVRLSRFENAFAVYGSDKPGDTDLARTYKVEPHPPKALYEPSPHSNLEVKSNIVTVVVTPEQETARAEDILPSSAKAAFSLTIDGPQSVEVGSAAFVDITVTNTSNHGVSIGLEDVHRGEFDFNFEVRDSQGAPAPETQYMKAVRREDQGNGPTMVITAEYAQPELKPGKALKIRADLAELFDLKAGKYTVQVSCFDNPFAARESGRVGDTELARLKVGFRAGVEPTGILEVKSNTVTMNVTP